MTGRTHDLIGFTGLTFLVATQSLPSMRLATVFAALAANLLGSITPDLDQPTAQLWHDLPTGSIVGHLVHPLTGSHRMITHSLLGLVVIGLLSKLLFNKLGTIVLVDMQIVWWTFMLGYFLHLVADTLTKDGVPWFFPIPWKIGFPPFKFMRITTGGIIEKFIIFPILLFVNGYLVYYHYDKFLHLFGH